MKLSFRCRIATFDNDKEHVSWILYEHVSEMLDSTLWNASELDVSQN